MRHDYAFPPRYAEHTRPVLAEAGFTDNEIAALAQQGIVSGV